MMLTELPAPASHFDVGLFDLDGVVYVGPGPVPHAVESILAAQSAGMAAAYVTNNASRTPLEVAEHLASFGLPATADDVVTSAQAGAHALQGLLTERGIAVDGPVLAVGGPGVALALRARGFDVTASADEDPIAVMQGFGPNVDWAALREASIAVGLGVPWVATNPDTSIPTPRGRAPGNGAFVQAVSLATGRHPDLIAGKPYRPLLDESVERTGAQRPIMIGDRLDTDIEAGTRTGVPTLLVMTGVTDVDDVVLAPREHRPDAISLDLRGLFTPHPAVHRSDRARSEGARADGARSEEEWICGDIGLSTSDPGEWVFAAELESRVGDPGVWQSAIRCLCAAAWTHLDEGADPVELRRVIEAPVRLLTQTVQEHRTRLGE